MPQAPALITAGSDPELEALCSGIVQQERVVLLLDPAELTVVAANARAVETLETELAALVGVRLQSLVLGSTDLADLLPAVNRGERLQVTFSVAASDGVERWLRATVAGLGGRPGAPARIVMAAFDITDDRLAVAEVKGRELAVDRAQAIIEFAPDGTVLTANDNFLALVDYSLAEVQGKHHSMFCEPQFVESAQYEQFWNGLRSGEFSSGEFKRIGRGGKEVWLQASYNPILDPDGKTVKVIKYGLDVTATKLRSAEFEGMVTAIGRAQAVVEFDLSGVVLAANPKFLDLMGYTADEVIGQHHRMFVDDEYSRGPQYRLFWQKLARGEYEAGEYRRIGKDGGQIWLQATYNPILDLNGRPLKVVKYAVDVTAASLRNAEFEGKVAAINRSQAVVEFDLQGRVLAANDNFLRVMGFALDDIVGKHHRISSSPVSPAPRSTCSSGRR